MSFDVFLQGFADGEPSDRGAAEIRELLAPYVVTSEGAFLRIQVGDGEADLYLDEGGLMANHIDGEAPWNLLVRISQVADWTILPVGCPTCLTRPEQRKDLPQELQTDAVLIGSGDDLRSLVVRRG